MLPTSQPNRRHRLGSGTDPATCPWRQTITANFSIRRPSADTFGRPPATKVKLIADWAASISSAIGRGPFWLLPAQRSGFRICERHKCAVLGQVEGPGLYGAHLLRRIHANVTDVSVLVVGAWHDPDFRSKSPPPHTYSRSTLISSRLRVGMSCRQRHVGPPLTSPP